MKKAFFGKLSAHWVPAADCMHVDSEGAQCISSIIGSGSSGNEEHLWILITFLNLGLNNNYTVNPWGVIDGAIIWHVQFWQVQCKDQTLYRLY